MVAKVDRELKLYNELRNKLIKELGEVGEDGNYEVKDKKKLKELFEKVEELQSVEVELDFEPIKLEEVGDVNIESRSLVSWIFE